MSRGDTFAVTDSELITRGTHNLPARPEQLADAPVHFLPFFGRWRLRAVRLELRAVRLEVRAVRLEVLEVEELERLQAVQI